MPVRLKLAFQGGGARLALYFPVIKALQAMEKEGLIEVTHVSGASAGAIAAALFAGKANVPALVAYFQGLERKDIISAFPPVKFETWWHKMSVAWKLARAQPFGNEEKLAELLKTALEKAEITAAKVGALNIPCYIASANLTSRQPQIAQQDRPLVQSLVDSAALPFMFRMQGETIDGGILDNLPIAALAAEGGNALDDSEIVAIGFAQPEYQGQVVSPLKLAMRLLEASLSERTEYAKAKLGSDHVFEVPVRFNKKDHKDIQSFSLDSFIAVVEDGMLQESVEEKTRAWFKNYIEQRAKDDPGPIGRLASDNVSEARDQSSIAQTQSAGLRTIASTYHGRSRLHFRRTILNVTAHCLVDPAMPDTFDYIDECVVKGEPVFSYVTKVFISNQGDVSANDLKVYDRSGQQMPIVTFSVPDSAEKHTWTLVLFDKALMPNGDETTFTVHSKQIGGGCMLPLVDKGHDYLTIQVNQAEVADLALIRLFVPEDVEISAQQGTRELIDSLKVDCMDSPDEDAYLVEGSLVENVMEDWRSCPAHFKPYVWRAENLKKKDVLRVIFTKR